MILTLPWPPTINHYYRTLRKGPQAGRAHITENGIAYRQAVSAIVGAARAQKRLDVRLAVSLEARPPDRRARDLDNLLKSSLDALQHAGVYVSDSQIDDLHIRRGSVEIGGVMQARIVPMDALPPLDIALAWPNLSAELREQIAALIRKEIQGTRIDTGWRRAMGDEVAR